MMVERGSKEKKEWLYNKNCDSSERGKKYVCDGDSYGDSAVVSVGKFD